MSCIHYKFKSSLDYNTVTFDGLHLSLSDLKKAISQQKRLKSGEFDLEITNAQTGDVYKKQDELIAKNTSVIVSRVPVIKTTASSTQKSWEAFKQECAKVKEKERQMSLEKLKQTPDLANAPASEIDKIKAVIDQSTRGFEQSSFVGKHQPHENYVCKRCGQKGHFVNSCPNSNPEDRIIEPRYKRTTGIPSTMLTIVDDPLHPGALLTQYGQFAVPTVDVQGYRETKKERPPFLPGENHPEPEKKKIPQELLCHICEDLCVDAAIAPCCGTSFCDECLREELLESEDHQCPSCKETNVSPDRIVANKSMRLAVTNFLNDTGYTKAKRRRSNSQSGEFGLPTSGSSLDKGSQSVQPALNQNVGTSTYYTVPGLLNTSNAGIQSRHLAPRSHYPYQDVQRQRFSFRAAFPSQFSYTKLPRFPADQYSKPWRYSSEAVPDEPSTISTISRRTESSQPRVHAEEPPPASVNIEKSIAPESGRSSPGEPAASRTFPIVDKNNSQELVPARIPSTWHPVPTPLLEILPTSFSAQIAPLPLNLSVGLPTHRIPLVTVPPAGHQPFTAVGGFTHGFPVQRPNMPIVPSLLPHTGRLTEEEFYKAKKMFQQAAETPKQKPVDVFDSFADFTKRRSYSPDKRRNYSRSRSNSWHKRSRSRSLTPIKRKSRSLSSGRFRSRSRSRSRPHSQNRSRSRSTYRSQNRSRSRSGPRLINRSRSRSFGIPKSSRPRSRSRSLGRLSKSPSRSRSGQRLSKALSPRPRSISPRPRSPLSPPRRSSKSPLSPLRRSPLPPLRRSKSPLPTLRKSSKSPLPSRRSRSRSYRRLTRSRSKSWSKRGRSRSHSRPRSPRPLSRSPRRSPLRSPFRKRSFSPKRRSRSLSPRKRSPFKSRSKTPLLKRNNSKSKSPRPKKRSHSPFLSPRRSKSPYKKPLSPMPFRRRSPSPHRGRGGFRGRGRGGYGYRDYNKENRDRFRGYTSPQRNASSSTGAPALSSSALPPVPYFPQMGLPPPEEYFKYNPAGYQEFVRNFYEAIAQSQNPLPAEGFSSNTVVPDSNLSGQRSPWDSVPMSPSQRPRSITPPSSGQNRDRRDQHFKDRDSRPWERDRERDRDRPDYDRERDRRPDRGRDDRYYRDNDRRNRGREDDRSRGRDSHRDNRDRDSNKNRDKPSLDRKKNVVKKDDEKSRGKDKKRTDKKKEEKDIKKSKKRTDSETKKEPKDSILNKTSPVSDKDLESPGKGDEHIQKAEKQEPIKPKNEVPREMTSQQMVTATISQPNSTDKPVVKEKKTVSKKKGDGVGVKKKAKEASGEDGTAEGEKKVKKTKKKKLTFGADADTKQGLKKKKLKRLVDYKSENCTSEDGDERGGGGGSPLKKAKLAELNQAKEGSADSTIFNNGDSSHVSSSEPTFEVSTESKQPPETEICVKEEPTASSQPAAVKKGADEKVSTELMPELPGLSKWEREDDFDYFDALDQPIEKPQEKMMLPRSVVDKAEKFLTHKPMKNAVMVAHVTTSTKSPETTPEKETDRTSESPGSKPSRRVFLDRKDSRDKRASDLQITVKSDKRKPDHSDKRAPVPSKTEDHHRHHHHHHHHHDDDAYAEDQRSVVKSHSLERELQDSKFASKNLKSKDGHGARKDRSARGSVNEDVSKPDPAKKTKSDSSKEKASDRSPDYQSRRHSRDSNAEQQASKSSKDLRHKLEEKNKAKSPMDHRKLAVMDESEFIPDYEDLAPEGTSDNEHDDATTSQNSESSPEAAGKGAKKRKREEGGKKEEEGGKVEDGESGKHKKGKKKHKHKEKSKEKKEKHKKKKHRHKKSKDKEGKPKDSKEEAADSS